MLSVRRLVPGVLVWSACFAIAAALLAHSHQAERQSFYDRFANRAATGSEFLGAFVEDVFDKQSRLLPQVRDNLHRQRAFTRTVGQAGYSSAIVLDRDGLVSAAAPAAPDEIGKDYSTRAHLGAALSGERAVSGVVMSIADGRPVVAFAQPLGLGDVGAVFAAGYDVEDSPLSAFVEQNPIRGTHGRLLDSSGAVIVASGDAAGSPFDLASIERADEAAVVVDGRVRAAAKVPGTPWTYVIDAPEAAILQPLSGHRLEWALLVGVAGLALGVIIFGVRASAARSAARRETARADARFRQTVENAPIGMAMLDLDHRFVEPNARLCAMLGYDAAELSRKTLEDVTEGEALVLSAEAFAAGAHLESTDRFVRRDGEIVTGRISVSMVSDDAVAQHYVVQIEDVTEFHAAQAELSYRASHDTLTGLANRRELMRRLEETLAAQTRPLGVGVGFCDLDGFKQINDVRGHHVGDAVLVEVARRLEEAVRADDTVARMGGDEFVVLLRDVVTVGEAMRVMERARLSVERPFEVDGLTLRLGLSGGLALGGIGDTADKLLADADLAMYAAKRAGLGLVELYRPELRAPVPTPAPATAAAAASGLVQAGRRDGPEQRRTEKLIRDALEHDRIQLDYQPVFELATGLMTGVEALLRLHDAEGRLVPPPQVVPAAERSGLIVALGWRVLQLATLQAGYWRDQHGVIVPVAVNVSAAQLGSSSFPDDVYAAVGRADIPPEALTLELTESLLMGTDSTGIQQLRELRDAGFALAIDDFGTGYATLSYLHELPATQLKIDRSFIDGIPDDRRAVAIVAGVVALAQNCGMTCVAEGIENERQRAHLAGLGVRGQGYALARPGSAAQIGTLIREGRLAPELRRLPLGSTSEDAEPADVLAGVAPATAGAGSHGRLDASTGVVTSAGRDVTGAYRREPGLTEVEREVARATRTLGSLVLAFVRVDGLDEVRDAGGPAAVNEVMRELADAMKEQLRPYDLVVRYGEDEFVCAVAGLPPPEAEGRFAALRSHLADRPGQPSINLGVAVLQPDDTASTLVERADAAVRHWRAGSRKGP